MKKPVKKAGKRDLKRTCLYVLCALVWVGVSVIASQLAVGYIMIFILGTETFVQPVWSGVYSALSYIVALALVIFVPKLVVAKIKATKKLTSEKAEDKVDERTMLGLRDFPTWTDIGLAPVGFIVYLLLAAGLVGLFSMFPWFDTNEAQDLGFSVYVMGFDRIVAFITLVVLAPIAEELIFRGWLYGRLRKWFSEKTSNTCSMILSIFLVSLLFGIVHLQWNVGVNVFAMSVVMCGLREITGTIYSGILLHMLKNGLAFYLLFVVGLV